MHILLIMGLSKNSANKARQIIHDICNVKYLSSSPIDLYKDCDEYRRLEPEQKEIYCSDEKGDCNYEQIFFFIINPTKEELQRWDESKDTIKNTSYSREYPLNKKYTEFGWL